MLEKTIVSVFKEPFALPGVKQINMLRQEEPVSPWQHPYFCPICQEFLLAPITTVCGHSFCDLCLNEYFLWCDQCPVCKKEIKGNTTIFNIALNSLVTGFLEREELDKKYNLRNQWYRKWLGAKKLKELEAGIRLDVRDKNSVWCTGVVVRLVNRYNQPRKFARIKIDTSGGDGGQQDFDPRSPRLAPLGFYTNRSDVPRYFTKKEGEWSIRMLIMEDPQDPARLVILKQYQTIQNSE